MGRDFHSDWRRVPSREWELVVVTSITAFTRFLTTTKLHRHLWDAGDGNIRAGANTSARRKGLRSGRRMEDEARKINRKRKGGLIRTNVST